jgi:sulfatase maturation enzyme AslB (radical SAM superfamily)
MAAKQKLFCSKPFSWFEVSRGASGEGETYVCCPSWLSKPIGNLLHNSVEEVWNSEAAAEIRRSILDGSFEYCSRANCSSLQSETWPVQPADAVTDPRMRRAIDENLQVLPWGPLEINASHDRSCNLSCPSCRTHVIMEHNRRDDILSIQKKLKEGALRDAKLLYVTGSGDPFGSPYLRQFLQTLDRSQMPALETIHLHSNGILWTKRMWQTIPEDVRALVRTAEISIDAASAETYAVNRRGGDFERLLENLDFIASELRPVPIQRFEFSMVVQANNFHEMADFVRMGKRFGVDSASLHRITNWGTFSDEEFRARAIHLPGHPAHRDFLAALDDPIFDEPIVSWANLASIRKDALAGAA